MPNWTKEQSEAINSSECGIIVSAAAGSGKTAVLAERISRFAAEGKDIENLIAVTFTHFAATEIKQRVKDVLKEKYSKNPTPALRKNMVKIQHAKICTIDSFMGELVRKNFAALDISPDFSYIDETEKFAVQKENTEKLLEEYYSTYADGFEDLLSIFGGEKDNEKISGAINKIYAFVQAIPFWEKWLDVKLEKYGDVKFFTDIACEIFSKELKECIFAYDSLLEYAVLSESAREKMTSEKKFILDLISVFEKKDWDKAALLVSSYSFPSAPRNTDKDFEKTRFSAYREKVKKIFSNEIFRISTKEAIGDLEKLRRGINCLCTLVKKYHKRNMEKYRRLNRFPFDAISHFAVSLVIKDYNFETRTYVPTELAVEISNSVTEVMIDEYQDTNGLQDLFFTAISDDSRKIFAVGDVKQSIYGFRRAEPKNFLRKADELYRIDLSKNFRSKKTILDFANFVCSALLNSDFFETDYSEKDMLIAGRESEISPDDVEINICAAGKREENILNEARLCAKKIKELVKSGYLIFDKDKNALRPVKFSDIAVLIRVMQNTASEYERIFKEENIPVTVGKNASLFESVEVNVISAMLSVINNPYRDLPLAAVMLSEMYGFSEEEISKIRIEFRDKSLYEGISEYSKKDEKTAEFLRDIEHFRLLSENIPVDSLVWKIMTSTDYITKVSCREFGYTAKENLLSFYDFSKKYSESFSGNLFSFIDFIEKAKEKEPADDGFLSEGNFVKIMSCHKSKGLEFPVCIISDMDSKLNFRELSESLVLNDELGISTDVRDDEGIFETTTFHREISRYINRKNQTEEIIRLLYVSLTRARDKLILITAYDNPEKLEKFQTYSSLSKQGISFIFSKDFNRFDDFIFSALAFHPEIKSDFLSSFENCFLREISPVTVNYVENIDSFEEKNSEEKSELKLDIGKIKEQINFSYDNLLSSIPAKISVTELVKNKYREENDGEPLIPEMPPIRVPEFMGKEKNGAFYGTAMHKFLSLSDLESDFEEEKRRLVSEKKLTEKEAEILREESIKVFKRSDIYDYIINADSVLREEDFVVSVPASLYNKKAGTDSEILLQGAIDVLCEYSDGIVIIDYKTDNKTENELTEKYAFQLYLYSVAAEKMFSKKVVKAFIWSFKLEKSIDVTPFFPENG